MTSKPRKEEYSDLEKELDIRYVAQRPSLRGCCAT